jgi:dTDP-4-dehydrorhamnose 3,5-epimerase
LSESADLHYKVTDRYHPASEKTLQWNDPAVGIQWPIEAGTTPLLSAKDAQGTLLSALETLP